MSGRVVLGRYRIVAPLARGGMGIIYLGRLEGAAGFAKPVVIKTVIPDAREDKSAQLFAREARIVSNLEHPSIVGVLDFGEADGEYVMVLEYVHGFHLGNWLRYVQEARGSMPIAYAVEVMLPALDALHFAHRLTRADGTPLDIVHRDVSPANILLDHLGHVKLHDFGIARMADDEFKTQDGTFRGTLSYTAPETLQGVAASARSDLYACAVVLYQLISGANPFKGQQPSETLHRVMTFQPPGLRSVRPEVGQALSDAIERAMQKDPALRFDSAESFASALREARTWQEDEAVAHLQRTIHEDFMGPEMTGMLGLETLQSRDAAWRAAQPEKQRTPLSSSRPPPRSSLEHETETASVPNLGGDPMATIRALPSAALLELAGNAGGAAPAQAAPLSLGETVETERLRKRGIGLGLGIGLGIGALALAGAAYALLLRPAPAPPPPRFLLIEKQADPAEPAAASASSGSPAAVSSGASPAAIAGASAVAVPAASAAVKSRPDGASSGSAITQAFQRQRGRIEACFRAHESEATGQQLNIRFQIEASGAVRSADLSPSSVAGTALGGCILSTARSTKFPAGDAPLSFSIPITARKSGG